MPPIPVTAVQTPGQIRTQATNEVNLETDQAVAPLQSQIGTLQGQEDKTLGNIKDMFGSILPFATAASGAVGAAYDTAQANQASIMNAATQRLNELKQTRAQEAQALAQKIGGPVAVGEFTDAVGPYQSLLASLGAGQQLHTNLYAQAGVQEANAWSGKVLPLIQVEETAKARNHYEEQKKTIQDQITALKSAKSSKINAKATEMQIREREYALQKADQKLNALKANRDWQATLRTLKNDERRIDMAQKELDLRRGETLGVVDGKPTIEAKKLTAAQQQQAQALGLSEREYQLRLKEMQQQAKISSQKLAIAQRATWAEYLDAAVNPQPGKTVSSSQAVPVPAAAAISGKVKDAYPDKASPTGYSRVITTKQTPVSEPITNPSNLVEYLVGHNVPRSVAIRMVKARLNLPSDWVPGQGDPNTGTAPTKKGKG